VGTAENYSYYTFEIGYKKVSGIYTNAKGEVKVPDGMCWSAPEPAVALKAPWQKEGDSIPV